jgi:hypothetical protein
VVAPERLLNLDAFIVKAACLTGAFTRTNGSLRKQAVADFVRDGLFQDPEAPHS